MEHTIASFGCLSKINQADHGGMAVISQEIPSKTTGVTGKRTVPARFRELGGGLIDVARIRPCLEDFSSKFVELP
jgi:hypothetical protein